VYENPSVLHSLGIKRQCRKVEVSSALGSAKKLIPTFLRNLTGASSPIKQLVVDQERLLLYSVSDLSSISVYSLAPRTGESNGIHLLCTIDNLNKQVAKCTESQPNQNYQVESLNIVKRTESSTIYAVAITTRGVRIYLSSRKHKDGETLEVKYVRNPPGTFKDPSSQGQNLQGSTSLLAQGNTSPEVEVGIKPGKGTDKLVSASFYAEGVTLLAFSPQSHGIEGPDQALAGKNDKSSTSGSRHSLCALCTDYGTRAAVSNHPRQTRWIDEPLHEEIDVDILEQGPVLQNSQVGPDEPSSLTMTNLQSMSQSLPVGHVWAIKESTVNPTTSDAELDLLYHMTHTQDTFSNRTSSSGTKDSVSKLRATGRKRSASFALSAAGTKDTIGCNSGDPVALTELSRQHVLPRKYYTVLTSQGLWILVKNQPVNHLFSLLQEPEEKKSGLGQFFARYGRDESCAMALAIAAKTRFGGGEVSKSNGYEASDASNGLTGPMNGYTQSDQASKSQWLSQRALMFYTEGGYFADANGLPLPHFKSQNPANGTAAHLASGPGSVDNLVHSGCYNGIALHFARLIRPFWKWSVTIRPLVDVEAAGIPVVRCRWTPEHIALLTAPLISLKEFLQVEEPFCNAIREFRNKTSSQHVGAHSNSVMGQHHDGLSAWNQDSHNKQRAHVLETNLVVGLFDLLDRTIQALSLFKVLQTSLPELPFSKLLSWTEPELQKKLNEMTWATLVTSNDGKVVACTLAKLLVERCSPEKLSSLDLVNRMGTQFPSFFSSGYTLQISAMEKLNEFEMLRSSVPGGSKGSIQEAVRLCYEGFGKASLEDISITKSSLEDICNKLKLLNEPGEALQLALHCAKTYAMEPIDRLPDPMSSVGQQMRKFCYELAIGLLEGAIHDGEQGSNSRSGSAQFAVPGALMKVAIASEDALWHFTLYDWLFKKGFKKQLLDVDSPFITRFLKDPEANDVSQAGPGMYESTTCNHVDRHYILLAEWCVNHKRFADAAWVMQNLAKINPEYNRSEQDETIIGPTLDQRVKYFELALQYARASESLDATPIQDELDVARLQQSVLNELKHSSFAEPRGETGNDREQEERREEHKAACEALCKELKNPSDLYNEFAYKYGLWRSCIRIMQECNYIDEAELQNLYSKILSETSNSFKEEGQPTGYGSAVSPELARELADTVSRLGRRFYQRLDPKKALAFPVEFLVRGLEDVRALHHADSLSVCKVFLEIGVPYEVLFSAYINYVKVLKDNAEPLGSAFLDDKVGDVESFLERSRVSIRQSLAQFFREWKTEDEDILYASKVSDFHTSVELLSGGEIDDEYKLVMEPLR